MWWYFIYVYDVLKCKYNVYICYILDDLMMWFKIVLYLYINVFIFECYGKIMVYSMDLFKVIFYFFRFRNCFLVDCIFEFEEGILVWSVDFSVK